MKYKTSIISIAMATIVLVSMVSVVSAASTPKVGVPATITGAPAAVAYFNGGAAGSANALVFAIGTDGQLYYRVGTCAPGAIGTWGAAWVSLSGYATSDPGAVANPATAVGTFDSQVNVFVRGGDGALWTRATTAITAAGVPTFGAWTRIGGYMADNTGPAAYRWTTATGSINPGVGALVVGSDGALWQNWNDGSSTTGVWTSLGGTVTATPAVAKDPAKTTASADIFVRGTNGVLWQKSWGSTGAFGAYAQVPGNAYLQPGTGPTVCEPTTGRLDVFVTGSDGALWHNWALAGAWQVQAPVWPNPTGITAWQQQSGGITSSPSATTAVLGAGNPIYVFARGADGFVYQKVQAPPTATGAPITPFVPPEAGWGAWVLQYAGP